jgi:hypothetical protein
VSFQGQAQLPGRDVPQLTLALGSGILRNAVLPWFEVAVPFGVLLAEAGSCWRCWEWRS